MKEIDETKESTLENVEKPRNHSIETSDNCNEEFNKKLDMYEKGSSGFDKVMNNILKKSEGIIKGATIIAGIGGLFGSIEKAKEKPNNLDIENLSSKSIKEIKVDNETSQSIKDIFEEMGYTIQGKESEKNRESEYGLKDFIIDAGQTIEDIGESNEDLALSSPEEMVEKAKKENEVNVLEYGSSKT